jgi:hypothetical protein
LRGLLFKRAIRRGVNLTLADLKPCPVNTWHSPSWFDLFSRDAPVEQVAAWREALAAMPSSRVSVPSFLRWPVSEAATPRMGPGADGK